MKTFKIITKDKILNLAKYKFTHIPKNVKRDFDLEKCDCFIFVTLKNGMCVSICYTDISDTKESRINYIRENEIAYIVFKYTDEVHSNVDLVFEDSSDLDYHYLYYTFDEMLFKDYNEHIIDMYY